jgi:putative acetyltransferase
MEPQLPLRFMVADSTEGPVAALLRRHLAEMHAISPAGSVYALDVEGFRTPSVTLWTAQTVAEGSSELVACGALNQLDPTSGEIKSVHTHSDWRGHGIGERFVVFLIKQARDRGYGRLSLETGAMESFAGARRLYARLGFVPCGPFGEYGPDPNSAFMTLYL